MKTNHLFKLNSFYTATITTLLFFCSNPIFADNPNNSHDGISSSPKKPQTYYCPSVSELTKDGLSWSAREGGWQSFSPSFAQEINTFLEAQWIGVNVGKIICLYQGKENFDFPIAIEPAKSILVLEPYGQAWATKHPGFKTCKSTNVSDCPFMAQQEESAENPYTQIKYHSDQHETTTP